MLLTKTTKYPLDLFKCQPPFATFIAQYNVTIDPAILENMGL